MIEPRTTFRLLIASAAFNVFLVGAIAGHLSGFGFGPPPPPPPPPGERVMEMVDEVAATLPADDAKRLRDAFRREEAALRRASAGLGETPRRLSAALRADPFDPEAVRRALADSSSAHTAIGEAAGRALAEAAGAMSREGRVALSEFRPPRPPRRP